MNLVDAYVTMVTGDPVEKHGKWFVEVEYESYGQISKTELMFESKEACLAVKLGSHFLTRLEQK